MSGGGSKPIFVVSDATAETAERTVRAALVQFRGLDPALRIFSMVRRDERLTEIAELAASAGALVVYTIVNTDQRELLWRRCEELGVERVDLIAPLMTTLGNFLGGAPAGVPGLPRLNDDYFRRIEAVEFAVKHDDGQSLGRLAEAEIVLVGVSRTSKTPLSTYLAQKGYKVANVPLVLGLPIPRELEYIDQHRIFGLTIDIASLIRIRRSRLKALNMPVDTDYARRDHILKELNYARDLFRRHSHWPVIDVSMKAIEETASVILRTMDERAREAAAAARS